MSRVLAPTSTRLIDVAREANVSVTTAGHVLSRSGGKNVRVSETTSRKVREAARMLNYRPNMAARQLAGKRSKILAAVFNPDSAPVNVDLFLKLERQVQERGYRLLVANPLLDPEHLVEYVDDMIARHIDGLVCFNHNYPADPELVPRQVCRLKHVVFIRRPMIEGVSYVGVDEADGTRQLVEYLVGQGRRPALAVPDLLWPGTRERAQAFREQWRAAGLDGEPAVWVGGERTRQDPQRLTSEAADAVIDELIVAGRRDALICQTDYWAAMLIRRLKRRGLSVPRDVGVVSYDNLDVASLIDPPLTTLDPQTPKIAQAALNMLLDSIEGRADADMHRATMVKPKLIVRESA